MRPVKQTEIQLGRGNCMAACLASILELSIDSVPNFRLADDPWQATQEWLATIGLFAIRLAVQPGMLYPIPTSYCILTGRSPRSQVGHAVVGSTNGMSWEIIHDPHPDGTGINGEPEWMILLGALHPEQLKSV